MTLVREFNLYLTAGRTIPLVINVNQFDSGEQWAFTVYKEDGTQYIPSTGAIVGIKSDNLGIINSGTVDENGRVIITETQQMTASVGKAVFELTLDSGTHGTANFVVLVEEKPGNNADLSDSDISLIQEALNAVSPLPTGGTVGQVLTKTAQGSAWSDAGTPTQAQVAEAVSDWADEHITVETGVVIDNSLSVAGAAADSKKVGDEISDLKSAFDYVDTLLNFESASTLRCPFTIVPNSQVASSTGVISSSTTNSRSDYTNLRDCKYITLTARGFVNYCFYDEQKAYISGGTSASGNILRPTGARFIIFTYGKNNISDAVLTLFNVPPLTENLEEEISAIGFEVQDSIVVTHVQQFVIVPNSQVASSTGVISSSTTNSRSDYTDLKDCDYITLSSSGFVNYCFYNAQKTYISGSTNASGNITRPANAKYVIFTYGKNNIGSAVLTLYNAKPNMYVAIEASKPWCHGKTINWIGDSIVAGSANFDYYVSQALGLNENDYGINGSTIALKSDGTDGRDAICLRYANMSDDADIIVVSAGTNDFQYNWSDIGTIESTDNTTFYGALKTLCEGLIDKYPKKLICFTTPIKRAQSPYTTPFSENAKGKTLKDYCDIIKEVCGYYSIPVLDMWSESLLNPSIESQQDMFDSDLTHPNTNGQKIMARRVAGWINQLGYIIS